MKLPKLKRMHNPQRLPGNRIRIGSIHYGVGSEIQDDENGNIWRLLELINGTRSIKGIVEEMQQIAPHFDTESIYQAIDVFITSGFVEDAGALPPTEFSSTELERYSRNVNFFTWIDIKPRTSQYEIQCRLKQARVTILGLGGTGSTVAMSLAASGVGSLHCVDFDKVEISNLNRQLIYTEDDIGLSKVDRAVEHLRRINSQIRVTGQELQVQSSNDIVPLMKGCDLFILCADKPVEQIQNWANDAAIHTKTPWLICFYTGIVVFHSIFLPFQTPCYECFEHNTRQQRELHDGGEVQSLLSTPVENSVIAPTAGIAGHLAALEAIYFLADLKPQAIGRIFHQNMMIYDHSYYVELPFWTDCPSCGFHNAYQQNRV